MLGIYWATASDPDAGQTLSAALGVVQSQFGLDLLPRDQVAASRAAYGPDVAEPVQESHVVILGLDLPHAEPHAVVVDIDGTWWSWCEPHTAADFPGAVIEEAWLV